MPLFDTSQKMKASFVVDQEGNVSQISLKSDRTIYCPLQWELRRVISSLPLWSDSLTNRRVRMKASYVVDLEFLPPGGTLSDDEGMFVRYDEMPLFRGQPAEDGFRRWVQENLRPPKEVYEQGFQGKVVVEFDVDEIGDVKNVRVMRSVHPLLDAEAVRVISSSPQWEPGKFCGNPVKVRYLHPIVFGTPESSVAGGQ